MNNIDIFNSVLQAFKLGAVCKSFSQRKRLSSYALELKPGARIRDVRKFLPELALALRLPNTPTLSSNKEEGLLRFEFLSNEREMVNLFDLGYCSPRPKGRLTCLLGETAEGNPLWMDLAMAPHLLIAGTTGSGKSTLLHALIANLLLHPETSIVLLDPKNIEFCQYEAASFPRIKVAFEFAECLSRLEELCQTMDERYRLSRSSEEVFPFIVLIIDEFASIMQQDEEKRFQQMLSKLAQKSRAANIHIVIGTQRPSVDVLDGTIKANFPARIACKVASNIDSRVILGCSGAEDLLGCGDALITSSQYELQRFQVANTSAREVRSYFGSN